MSKAKRTLDRRKTLEEELQEIYEQRQHRKSTFSVATQIVFLEMDLHGLFVTRSFSHRKMLSYLHDNICMFEKQDNKQLEEKASVFSRDGLLAPMRYAIHCQDA